MQNVGMELADELVAAHQAATKTQRRSRHIDPDNLDASRKLAKLPRKQHDQDNIMPARLHALGQRHNLALRAADAERGEPCRRYASFSAFLAE